MEKVNRHIVEQLSPNEQIVVLAEAQQGVVAYGQLVARGFSRSRIESRTRSGWLRRVFRGVYAVGHRSLTDEGWMVAALLATGPDSMVTGRSAGRYWEVSRFEPQAIELVLPRRHHGFPPTVATTRSSTIDPVDMVIRGPLRVATVPRLLVDMSTTHTKWQLANVLKEAAFRRRLHMGTLRRCMERNGCRAGRGVLQQALDLYLAGSAGTRSDLEDGWLAQVVAAHLPEPLVNMPHLGYELDTYWPNARLNFEVDGRGSHSRPNDKHKDEGRDEHLRRMGVRVIRIGKREIDDGSALGRLRTELRRSG